MKVGEYLGNLFVSIDQLGNAIAGGNADNTISARVGFYSHYGISNFKLYWRMLEFIIDTTFWPIDGKHHCRFAYFNDAGENFKPSGNAFMHYLLSVIIIASCIPLFIIFHILYLFRIVKPKTIDRPKAIEGRLVLIRKKMDGILLEMNEENVTSSDEMKSTSATMVDKANEVNTEILAS